MNDQGWMYLNLDQTIVLSWSILVFWITMISEVILSPKVATSQLINMQDRRFLSILPRFKHLLALEIMMYNVDTVEDDLMSYQKQTIRHVKILHAACPSLRLVQMYDPPRIFTFPWKWYPKAQMWRISRWDGPLWGELVRKYVVANPPYYIANLIYLTFTLGRVFPGAPKLTDILLTLTALQTSYERFSPIADLIHGVYLSICITTTIGFSKINVLERRAVVVRARPQSDRHSFGDHSPDSMFAARDQTSWNLVVSLCNLLGSQLL
jgi:hypothetical protein